MRKTRFPLISAIVAMLLLAVGLVGWTPPTIAVPATPSAVRSVSTRFTASRNGFPFINHAGAEPGTFLYNVFYGLCGGMTYAALDYFHQGVLPPAKGIDRFLLVRDAQSLVANADSFVLWTLAGDTASPKGGLGVGTATRQTSVPELAQELRNGPVPLGLVKARTLRDVWRNHQVLAYSLERRGSSIVIGIYDPNHPRADHATLSLDLRKTGPVIQTDSGQTVDAWRGFFLERYSPATPPR